MTKDEMIAALQNIATITGLSTVPRHLFLKETGLSEREVYKSFGTYNDLVEAAGLKPRYFPTPDAPTYSDSDLLKEIVRVLRLPESKLTRIFFEQNASVSSSACERRFGGWINALKKCKELLDLEKEASLINRINEYTATFLPKRLPQEHLPKQESQIKEETNSINISDETQLSNIIPLDSSNIYGDFINFRGLQHAPVNEQGVVFLFGMICRELGYVVESIHSGFPDCEAKRQISGRKSKWQRVRIEFEFESRTFRSHGHDPDQCDIIVCWENNWPDCPIEVLELKSSMKRLSITL